MRKSVLLAILSAMLFSKARSQAEIGIKPIAGFLFAHHNVMRYLVQSHAWGAECYYEKPVSGQKPWHNLYRQPEIGYMVFAGSLGNPVNIGWGAAFVPYIKFHPVERKIFHFNIKSGMGVGYLSNHFDRSINNKNVAIGSHVNIVFNVGFEPEWRIGPWDLGAGVSFIHYSNGAWKVPNLGYNIPAVHLNIGYRIERGDAKHRPVDPNQLKEPRPAAEWKKWSFQVVMNAGIKERLPINGPKYLVACFSAMAVLRHSDMSSFTFSSETYYNAAYRAGLAHYYETEVTNMEAMRTGVAVGYGLNLGRLLLSLQNGYYLVSSYRSYDGSFFHRLGARYVFDNGIVLHGGLKTHFAKADNFEFGVGYAWGKLH